MKARASEKVKGTSAKKRASAKASPSGKTVPKKPVAEKAVAENPVAEKASVEKAVDEEAVDRRARGEEAVGAKAKPKAGAEPKAEGTDAPVKSRRRVGAPKELVRRGVGVSPGLASGLALVVRPEILAPDDRVISEDEVESEVERFLYAVRRSRDEIAALRECLLGEVDDPGVRVLEAHLLILEDKSLLQGVRESIENERRSAAGALFEVLSRYIQTLEQASTEYFRGRSADLRDVQTRLLRHLNGGRRERTSIPEGAIVVAADVSPSEAAAFDPERIGGIVVDHGGATSHAAILARARGIPAVVGLRDLSRKVETGDLLLVDGGSGQVIVDPTPETRSVFLGKMTKAVRVTQRLVATAAEPAVTEDGTTVSVCANIETRAELPTLERLGCDGIGLFRTEYFFLERNELPHEEEQYESYLHVVSALAPRPVTLRVLDVGGDKFAAFFGLTRSENPFLGVRGIRFLLDHPEILRTQVRAVLRAAVHGNVRLLLPMISSVEEMREVNRIVDEEQVRLRKQGLDVPPVPRGAMVETPAAVLLLDLLAAEADFFSIGSNDLIQYTLAVDRGNENVAHLYDPYHPAILRALRDIVVAADRADRPVTCCGEMSGDLYGVSILLGLGCLHLSVSPAQLPRIKDLVRRSRLTDLARMMERALEMPTSREVKAWVRRCVDQIVGGDEG